MPSAIDATCPIRRYHAVMPYACSFAYAAYFLRRDMRVEMQARRMMFDEMLYFISMALRQSDVDDVAVTFDTKISMSAFRAPMFIRTGEVTRYERRASDAYYRRCRLRLMPAIILCPRAFFAPITILRVCCRCWRYVIDA